MTRKVLGQEGCKTLGMGTPAQGFGMLLDLDPLSVHVGRLLRNEPEPGASGRSSTSALRVGALQRLSEKHRCVVLGFVEFDVTRSALEHRVPDLRPDFGNPANDPVDGDQMIQVGLAQVSDRAVSCERETDRSKPEPFRFRAGDGKEVSHRPSASVNDFLGSLQ